MFSGLVEEMFSSFTNVMTGMSAGLQNAFNKLIYANGVSGDFSDITVFLFIVLGIALGTGILFGIFNLIKGVAHRNG